MKFKCRETTVNLEVTDPRLDNLIQGDNLYRQLFTNIFAELVDPLPENNKVRVLITHEDFQTPISLPFIDKKALTIDLVFDSLDRVVQSKKKDPTFEQKSNKKMQIAIFIADNPKGSGRRALSPNTYTNRVVAAKRQRVDQPVQDEWLSRKRCIRRIFNIFV